MEKNAKIYVAGHKGLVGSSVVRKLQKDGYKKVLTKTSKELDLRRQADVEAFFERERPEYVILAAAKVGGILANSTYTAEFIYDNLIIAANVVQSAYRYGVKKLLNLGSSCIYPKLAPQPIREEHLLTGVLEPTNESYAVAKIAGIKLCRYYNEQYGTNFISGMPANLYGTHDNFNLETAHVLPTLIRKFHLAKLFMQKNYDEIKKDLNMAAVGFNLNLNLDTTHLLEKLGITPEYLILWGSGEPYREFLYVDDLAEACIFLMERYCYKEIGEVVNIGTGKDVKIKELASLIQKIVKYEGAIKYDTSKPDGTPKKLLDVSRLKSLGWQSKTSLEEGIRNVYDWYLSRL